MRATITNIADEDIIHCFQNELFLKHTYHNFGRNRPTTAVELRDMMAQWADQENEENDRFPKRNNDKQVRQRPLQQGPAEPLGEPPKAQARPRSHGCQVQSAW
jgi:hypothetical protein